jgi:hypothetical protein
MSACSNNVVARASSLCSSTRGRETAYGAVDRSIPMATFGTKSEAASRVADSYSGRGNFEMDDGRKVKAAALPEVCSGERPFPSVALK